MTAPTLVAYAKSTSDTFGGNPHTTPSFTWLTGDFFTTLGCGEAAGESLTTPTTGGSGLTFAALGSPVATDCWTHSWTATASAASSGTIASSASANQAAVIHVWQWRDHGGVGTNNRAANVTGTPATISLTVAQDSAVVLLEADFNAAAAGVAGHPTSGPTPTERSDNQIVGRYSYSAYDHIGITAGTRGYGLSSVTGRDSTMVAVEVLGLAGGPVRRRRRPVLTFR